MSGIKFRGIYSTWSCEHGNSYNEILVLYTIREQGYCTQKQICDSYLLPRQTMNHVLMGLRNQGILQYCKEHSVGKEKAYSLTEQGREYATPFLESLDIVESSSCSYRYIVCAAGILVLTTGLNWFWMIYMKDLPAFIIWAGML